MMKIKRDRIDKLLRSHKNQIEEMKERQLADAQSIKGQTRHGPGGSGGFNAKEHEKEIEA